MTTLGALGEREIIKRLAPFLAMDYVGDDTAVLPEMAPGVDGLLTSDPLIEGVHFLPETEPKRIGHKATGRVLSDIAAMGGEPRWLLINVVAPAEMNIAFLESVYEGAQALADRFGAKIIGGDTAEGPHFQLHVFAFGHTPTGQAIRRSGAQDRDGLYVTGELGGSQAGHHLDFIPRLAEGQWLREQGFATSMIDLSDGLATDLRHLVEQSGLGAKLNSEALPRRGGATVEQALTDGEDYELLFTAPESRAFELIVAWNAAFDTPCSLIGLMDEKLEGIDGLDETAFEHFSS